MSSVATGGALVWYCPHASCAWSFAGTKKRADGYLEVHLRIVHKGADPRPAPEPAKAAAPVNGEAKPAEKKAWDRRAKTRDELVACLRRFHEEEGRPPTATDRRDYLPTPTALIREFGSRAAAFDVMGWERPTTRTRTAQSRTAEILAEREQERQAAREAGPAAQTPTEKRKPGRPKIWTRDKLIAELQRWAVEHDGVPPVQRDWAAARDGYPTASAVKKEFNGSWGAGIAEAGFPSTVRPPQRRRVADTEVLGLEPMGAEESVPFSASPPPALTGVLQRSPGPASSESSPEPSWSTLALRCRAEADRLRRQADALYLIAHDIERLEGAA